MATVSIPVAVAEQVEAEAALATVTAAADPVREELGIASLRLGGGVAVSMRHGPPLWNRALGFGVEEPVTRELVDEICDFYRAQGAQQALLQIAPSVLPDDWSDICAATGIVGGYSWVKLARELGADDGPGDPLRSLDPDLRLDAAAPADAAEWGVAYTQAFGHASAMSRFVEGQVGGPGWHSFAVRDHARIVAVGALFARGDAAELFGGATLPGYRNRGAQSAVIAARIAAARAAGCRWVVAESGAEQPGEHNPSLHNLRRAGLGVLYERRNWIWRPTAE